MNCPKHGPDPSARGGGWQAHRQLFVRRVKVLTRAGEQAVSTGTRVADAHEHTRPYADMNTHVRARTGTCQLDKSPISLALVSGQLDLAFSVLSQSQRAQSCHVLTRQHVWFLMVT